jgi:hypothetical protein
MAKFFGWGSATHKSNGLMYSNGLAKSAMFRQTGERIHHPRQK